MFDVSSINTGGGSGIGTNSFFLFPDSLNIGKTMYKPFDFTYNPFLFNDFYSSLMLFDLFARSKVTPAQKAETITTNFNTNTSLASLKNVYSAEMGNTFANIAHKNARSIGTTGWCLRGVQKALERAGLHRGGSMGASAYQAVGNLSNNKNFKQVQVTRNDLKDLPAGCIIVWAKTSKNPHGHIAVTLGNGKEASDHVQSLITNRNASFSVYAPVKADKIG